MVFLLAIRHSPLFSLTLQVLLDEAGAEVKVELPGATRESKFENRNSKIARGAPQGFALDGPVHLRVCKYKP